MIVLLNDGTAGGGPDELRISCSTLALAAVLGVQWYCTWYNTASSSVPYRSSGFQLVLPAPAVAMNTPLPTLMPQIIQEINEITIFNSAGVPMTVYIDFFNGGSGSISRLMQCILGGDQTLSYNATPGQNGSWAVRDSRASLISQR